MDYKDKLLKVLKKKLSTSFIGAIAEIERRCPELVNSEKWEDLRNAILTNGNSQIRAIEKELDNYEVTEKRYEYYFKMRGPNEKGI